MFPRWGPHFNLVANFTCHKVPRRKDYFYVFYLTIAVIFQDPLKHSQLFFFPKTLAKGTHFLGSFSTSFPLSTISIQKCSPGTQIQAHRTRNRVLHFHKEQNRYRKRKLRRQRSVNKSSVHSASLIFSAFVTLNTLNSFASCLQSVFLPFFTISL